MLPIVVVMALKNSPGSLVIHHDLAFAVDQMLANGGLLVEERILDESGKMLVQVRNF